MTSHRPEFTVYYIIVKDVPPGRRKYRDNMLTDANRKGNNRRISCQRSWPLGRLQVTIAIIMAAAKSGKTYSLQSCLIFTTIKPLLPQLFIHVTERILEWNAGFSTSDFYSDSPEEIKWQRLGCGSPTALPSSDTRWGRSISPLVVSSTSTVHRVAGSSGRITSLM